MRITIGMPIRARPSDDPNMTKQEERRSRFEFCASCRAVGRPMVYLENGRSYCEDCDKRLQGFLHMRAAGTRTTDARKADTGD